MLNLRRCTCRRRALLIAHATTHTCACGRGYNIGVRLVDEFLAKAQIGTCQSFQETAEVIAKARR